MDRKCFWLGTSGLPSPKLTRGRCEHMSYRLNSLREGSRGDNIGAYYEG